ncbi:MAG: hypothetical protein HY236_17830, partial [Acidobacteria bacterium]|nr:hypothetical protein [Acidobacteriota bacterium]
MRTTAGLVLFPLLLPMLAGVKVSASGSSGDLVVRGASVFDSGSKSFLPGRTVIIRDGKIVSVTPQSAAGIRRGRRVVDARGKFLIPGLIDAHAHVTTVLHEAAMTGEEVFPFWLANGVTTLRSTADTVAA